MNVSGENHGKIGLCREVDMVDYVVCVFCNLCHKNKWGF